MLFESFQDHLYHFGSYHISFQDHSPFKTIYGFPFKTIAFSLFSVEWL